MEKLDSDCLTWKCKVELAGRDKLVFDETRQIGLKNVRLTDDMLDEVLEVNEVSCNFATPLTRVRHRIKV